MRRAAPVLGALLLTGLSAARGGAQTKPVEFLTAVPEAPAFTYLGTTPTTIQKPGSLRDFGVSTLSGIGADGKAREGFAVDASLWNLIPGLDVPLEDYQSHWYSYAIGNLQASLATARAAGDSASLRGALGLKTVFYDGGDPLRDRDLASRLASGLETCRPAAPGAGQSIACVDSVTADIIGTYTRDRWNAAQLAAAVAVGTRFANSEVDRSGYDGVSGWIVGSLPLGTRIQIIGQAGYRYRTAVDTIPAYRAASSGIRAVLGSATVNGFVEYGREWRSLNDDSQHTLTVDRSAGGWSTGLELRLADNTWLTTGVGTQFQALGRPDRSGIFAGVRWGIVSQPRIARLGS